MMEKRIKIKSEAPKIGAKLNFLLNILLWMVLVGTVWGGDSFYISVRPEYKYNNNAIEFHVYANYRDSTIPVVKGSGKFEIFYENSRQTGIKGKLFFNRKTGRWETGAVDVSTLAHGEYYNIVSITDEHGDKARKQLFFFIIIKNKLKIEMEEN